MGNKMIVFFVSLVLGFSFYVSGQIVKPAKLLVMSVNFRTTVTSRVNCDEFAVSFHNIMHNKVIESIDTINILEHFLDSIKYASKDENMDVRAKFVLDYYHNKRVIICMDYFNIKIDGALIEKNRTFWDFLKQLTKD